VGGKAEGKDPMGAIEALILVRRHGCRVTFAEVVIVETYEEHPTRPTFVNWREVSRASTFAEAVRAAAKELGWER
jgi:hypothetical protein